MTSYIKNIFRQTKNQPIDVWFFFLFLLTFCLSVRKVWFYFPIQRTFNEYSGIYIYISDIFLLLAIGSWLLSILYNNKNILSNILVGSKKLFHVEQFYIILPLLLTIWSFISIFWSQNNQIALFRSLKLFEFFLLYIYILLRIVPRGTILIGKSTLKCSTWNIMFLAILFIASINSFLGIAQTLLQHSVGLFWLKESLVSPSIPGVAKIILNGHAYIRAYGLFPHPNILGGFLLFSIIVTMLYKKLFHVEHYRSSNLSTLINGLFLLQVIALFLAFSKSAWIGLLIAISYITYSNVPRLPAGEASGTFELKKFCAVIDTKKLILIFLILISLLIIVRPDFSSIFINSLQERSLYLNVSRGTILENPLTGTGMGQFVIGMQQYTSIQLLNWQFQPVHNVFLLIWSELGIVGFILFTWFLWKLFHVEQFQKKIAATEDEKGEYILCNNIEYSSSNTTLIYFKAMLLGFIFIMLFDHYLWDIQQGNILLWMTLGFIAGIKKNMYNKNT